MDKLGADGDTCPREVLAQIGCRASRDAHNLVGGVAFNLLHTEESLLQRRQMVDDVAHQTYLVARLDPQVFVPYVVGGREPSAVAGVALLVLEPVAQHGHGHRSEVVAGIETLAHVPEPQ